MRARVLRVRGIWLAVSASRGWPVKVRRAWIGANELCSSVWHAGFIVLGVSAEIRAGWGEP